MRYVRRGLDAARIGEALCFGAAAGWATATAAIVSGAAPGVELLALSGSLGVCTALTWVLGARTSEARLVRRLDDGLRFGGALVTAFEAERDARDGSVVRLLEERVRTRLRRDEALRSVLPPVSPPVVVLLASVALWLAAGRVPAGEPPVDVAALVEGARLRVSAARGAALEELEAGQLPSEEIEAWKEALAQLERLDLEAGPQGLEALDATLAERVPRAAAHPALAEPLAEARAQLDAARAELERRQPTVAPNEPGPVTRGDGELTNGAGNGTMPGSIDPVEVPEFAPAQPSSGAERAAWTTWWPDEYDALVRGWVDRPLR